MHETPSPPYPAAGILCVGAAHWDIIGRAEGPVAPGDDVPGQIERRLGGVALNVAIALGRAGHPVGLSAVVGADRRGAALIEHAVSVGVDCTTVATVDGRATDSYLAIESGDGNLVAAIADAGLNAAEADVLFAQASPALNTARDVLIDANLPGELITRLADIASAQDVRVTLNAVSPAKAPRLIPILTHSCRPTIVANLAEAEALTGQSFPTSREAAMALTWKGAGAALVTDGPRTASLGGAVGLVAAAPSPMPEGASVTGAGDALIAGFLSVPDRDREPEVALKTALDDAAHHMTARTRA